MPYNRLLDTANDALGRDGRVIDLSVTDFTPDDTVKGVVVVTTGNVVCRPLAAATDLPAIGPLPAGYILPWHCLVIRKTGTTAVLATVED